MCKKWKYVKELKNSNLIEEFEKTYSAKLPIDFKKFVKINNGGRPYSDIIDTETTKERVFKCLLSFNKEDKENIFSSYEILKKEDTSLIPFASDPSGNFFCIKDNKIFLWLHENGNLEFVSNSFSEMLDKLYI